jgi:hypothetical protein
MNSHYHWNIPSRIRSQMSREYGELCVQGKTPLSWASVLLPQRPRHSKWEDADPLSLLIHKRWTIPLIFGGIALLADNARLACQGWGFLGLSWIFWISLKAVFEVVLVVKTRGREFNTFTTIYFPAILRDRCFMFLRSYLIGDVPWYSWKSMLLWGVCVFVMVTKMHPTLVVFYSQGLLRSMIHGPSPSGVVGWLKHLGFEWFNLELGSALGILVASVLQSVGMACFGVDISALH